MLVFPHFLSLQLHFPSKCNVHDGSSTGRCPRDSVALYRKEFRFGALTIDV